MEFLSLLTAIVSLIALIVFFVMASNIGSIARNTRNIDSRLLGIQSSLDRIIKNQEGNSTTTTEDKAKKYDSGNKQYEESPDIIAQKAKWYDEQNK